MKRFEILETEHVAELEEKLNWPLTGLPFRKGREIGRHVIGSVLIPYASQAIWRGIVLLETDIQEVEYT